MKITPLISICIPSYNRANLLPALMDSILIQDFVDFEIVIVEDNSPEREHIKAVVIEYQELYPSRIKYYENTFTLGYDNNLRRLIELATGKYVLFMGNDDLLAPNALNSIANAVIKNANIGVVLRSYSSFLDIPESPIQTFRYFDDDRYFSSGIDSVVTFFRRAVFISGMVFKREAALKVSTNKFDGTLLYQQHLVGQILKYENGFYLHNIISYHRLGGIPDFGNSEIERDKFVPKNQTLESSVFFMKGMITIAKSLDETSQSRLSTMILKDIGNYSYPILSIQSKKPFLIFLKYISQLAGLGFWKAPLFHVYAIGLLLFGSTNCDRLIVLLKGYLGRAPVFGKISQGKSLK